MIAPLAERLSGPLGVNRYRNAMFVLRPFIPSISDMTLQRRERGEVPQTDVRAIHFQHSEYPKS